MLFLFVCVMDPSYNLKSTKLLNSKSSNKLILDTPITYNNLESTLVNTHNSYAIKLSTNVSRTPSAPSRTITLKEDEVELLYLMEEIKDIQGTSSYYSISPSLHNESESSGLLVVPEELKNYFKQEGLRNVEPTDPLQFDLLEFGRTNERRYPIISVIAKDLLTHPVSR